MIVYKGHGTLAGFRRLFFVPIFVWKSPPVLMTHYAENRRQTFKMKLIFVLYIIEFKIKFVSLIYNIS